MRYTYNWVDEIGYETLSRQYCEYWGILEYKVDRNKLIYYRNYYSTYEKKKKTVKFVVNLDTKETTKTPLKRCNKLGDWSM